MKSRVAFVAVVAAVITLAVAGAFIAGDRAEAQGPQQLRTLVLQGNVTIAGQPASDGLRITAKIRNDQGEVAYTSQPAIVGEASPGRYTTLVVGPAPELEGRAIEFWLEDQVISSNVEIFAQLIGSSPCLGCSWTLPILRTRDLAFPTAPVATPTPSPSPTPTRVVLQPSLYSGRVVAGSAIPPDGTAIYARVGDYVSPFSIIEDGSYRLVVNPASESYLNEQVVFFIGEFRAVQSATFKGGEFLEDFNLIFEDIPPSPTPTPAPPTATPTAEPTRTPTPAPSPSPTATSTATPTTIAGTATPDPDEGGGGGCNSYGGGPASVGGLALLLSPLGLWVFRRLAKDGKLPR